MYAHAQSPVRIGIAGGGTDLPAWTRERKGLCLSLAIRTYTHAACILRPDRQVVASYSQRDVANCATEIANGLIRESALLHGFEDGFEVHILSEVSSRGSGLGVSSSIAVSLAACFARMREMLRGGEIVHAEVGLSPAQFEKLVGDRCLAIARDAWEVEIDRLRRPIGRQDHMAAAYGGLRLYAFEGDGAEVERVFSEEDAAWVARHLGLVQLPEGHDSRAILSGVRYPAQVEIARDAVAVAIQAIEGRDLDMLGRALDMGQRSKTKIPGAVPPAIAEIVTKVQGSRGVRGCKVAGAGGGGHVVVAIEPHMESITGVPWLGLLRAEPDHGGVRSEGWA